MKPLASCSFVLRCMSSCIELHIADSASYAVEWTVTIYLRIAL